jgi:hypothetical protein
MVANKVPKVPRTRRPPKAAQTPTTPEQVNAVLGEEGPATPAEVAADLGEYQGYLKIVIQLRLPKAIVAVSQPGKDPHLVSLEMLNVQGLEQVLAEVPGIVALARERWALTAQYPKYVRPAPPPRPATQPVTRARTAPTRTARMAPPTPSVERPQMF